MSLKYNVCIFLAISAARIRISDKIRECSIYESPETSKQSSKILIEKFKAGLFENEFEYQEMTLIFAILQVSDFCQGLCFRYKTKKNLIFKIE